MGEERKPGEIAVVVNKARTAKRMAETYALIKEANPDLSEWKVLRTSHMQIMSDFIDNMSFTLVMMHDGDKEKAREDFKGAFAKLIDLGQQMFDNYIEEHCSDYAEMKEAGFHAPCGVCDECREKEVKH